MKKIAVFAVFTLLLAAGCTTQYQARAPYDDVYYSSRNVSGAANTKVVVKQSQEPAAADNAISSPQKDNQAAATAQYAEPGSDNYINNNSYDDYYDYAYASRLRRFHSNYYFPSYYNDFYTNTYWYDYNPWNWGTSIYYNSGWFGPSFGMSLGWGWPSYSYGWGGYPSYGGYWNGYNDGYYNGYYNRYYSGINNIGWYANEGQWFNNDKNYYYGHRGQSEFAGGSSNGRNTSGVNGQAAVRTLKGSTDLNSNNVGRNARNMSTSPAGVNARASSANVSRDASSVSSRTQQNSDLKQTTQPGRGRYITPSQNSDRVSSPGYNSQGRTAAPQTRYTNPQQKIYSRENTNAQPRGNVYRDNAPRPASQPARSYTQPGTRIQSYSSPSYSKPRSSQEYTTPKYRDMRNNNNQNYSQPQQRSGSSPDRNGGGTIRESTSRRSSTNESQPSRSTYTAPSRSSENSYSAPARSNSNSSSGSSERSSSSGSSSPRSGRR